MRAVAMIALLAALALGFAPAPPPRPKKAPTSEGDLKALSGKWRRTSLMLNGKRHGEIPGSVVVTVKGDVLSFGSPGDTWKVALDATKAPRRLDCTNVTGGNTYWGVYRLDGDSFTLCWRSGATEADRPAGFDPQQPNVWVHAFERVKE
jgi:uncharacterized protein (TIGR03067 family)